jgi:hypothetical protein
VLDRLTELTADTLKQCFRVCRNGKACGNGCISQERQCTKTPGCACNDPGSSLTNSRAGAERRCQRPPLRLVHPVFTPESLA